MNKQLLYAYSQVGKGWWPLLDKYIPAILEIDAECDFDPKEKYGELRLEATPSADCENRMAIYELEQEAENESATVCEYCGKPGRLRTEKRSWYLTLCDECDVLGNDAVRALHDETYKLLREMEDKYNV